MQHKKLTAENFIETFIDFAKSKTKGHKWIDHWNSDKGWTEYIIGTKKSSLKGSPLGNYFHQHFKNKNLKYRKEDGLCDLTMSTNGNLKSIPTLYTKYYRKGLFHTDKYYKYFPSVCEVIIEHENNIYNSWEEVAKLIYSRAFLKVLITYNSNRKYYMKENEMMIDTFKSLLGQMNAELTEDKRTEYLLLVGRKEKKNNKNKLIWEYSIFDTAGNIKRISYKMTKNRMN